MGSPTPVPDAQRIALLDVLRGFAVLGILLANIPFMALATAIATPFGYDHGGQHWTDAAAHTFTFLFADAKFLTIFSTLFGAGLGLMSEKALAAGQPFTARYTRRLATLFCIGGLHVALLWFGDILVVYSILGFVAMWFRKRQPQTLCIVAGILLTLNLGLWLLLSLIPPTVMVEDAGSGLSFRAAIAQEAERYRDIFGSGDFPKMLEARAGLFAMSGVMMLVFIGMRTLALMLLGIAIMKSGGFNRFGMRRPILIRTILVGGAVGLALQLWAHVVGYDLEDTAARLQYFAGWYLGSLALALAYVAAFTLWMHTNLALALRARLAAVGRMALTNYLSHSLITAILFNYCRLFDQLRRPSLLLVVLAIFAFQLWFSPLWLRHFRYGPVEWIWRMATYLRILPIRRTS